MQRCLALFIFAAVTCGPLPAQEQKPPEAAADEALSRRVGDLIKQLDADDPNVRDAATDELKKLGEPALPLLAKVLADPPSVEVKFRAQSAVDAIKLELVRKSALKIDDILAQAREAQKERWEGKTLQAQLERLIEVLKAETGKKELKLPISVNSGRTEPGPFVRGGVVGQKRAKIAHCHGAVVLADTVAQISHANDSIIIARGAACISHCTNCVVIAGQVIEVGHSNQSILLCNSETNVSHAHGSVLAGPQKIEVSHSEGTAFVNAPAPRALGAPIPGRSENKSVTVQGIEFGEKTYKNPLAGKLALTLAIERDQPLALFKLKDGTGDYVAWYEQEIKTPQGEIIEDLKGWRLIYAGDDLAIFVNEDEIACVRRGR